MLKTSFLLLSAFLMFGSVSFAERTTGEAASATANDAKRSMKKGANRVKEAVCMEGDAKCLAKKAKHRAEEGADTVKDKAHEVKDQVD